MNPTELRLVVADPDPLMRDLLRRHLARAGYAVDTVPDAASLGRWLRRHQPNLLVLERDLPGAGAVALIRELRARDDTPVILLSRRDDCRDRIGALNSGADDYLVKPFDPDELLARIGAVLRRYDNPSSRQPLRDHIRFGPYDLDLEGLELTRNGTPVALTAGEMDLLRVFATHPGRVLGRDRLLDLLKGEDWSPLDRSVDVQVARLRGRIEDDRRAPRYIRTVWGKGYKFTPEGRRD